MNRIILGAVLMSTIATLAIEPASGREQAGAFTETSLWSGADVPFLGGGGVTADGTKLVLADLDDKLYIRDLPRGTTDVRELKGGRLEDVKPSPAGTHVAVTWWDDQLAAYQLRVITLSTLSVNVLYGEKGRGRPRPLAWTPDGRSVLAWIPEGKGGTLSLLNVSGQPARMVKRFEEDSLGDAGISPNGRWIAFSSAGLWLIRPDGTGESQVLEDPRLQMLGWFPDGRRVLFAGTRKDMTGIWTVDVNDGRASAPRFIKPHAARIFSGGFSDDGRFFARLIRGGMNAYVTGLDPATGRSRGSVALLRDAEPDVRRVHATWAPDSRRIAFLRSAALQPTTLVVLDTENGTSRRYGLTMTNLGRPVWHPGGERLAIHEETGQVGAFELDLRTGAMKQILGPTNAYQYAPDGDHIVYRRRPAGGLPNAIVKRHLSTGEESVLYNGPGGFRFAPDGKSFLLYTRNNASLWHAPVGGQPRLVFGGIKAPANEFALSHDGRTAYFVTTDPWEVWRVPMAGGDPEAMGVNVPSNEHISLSPDGRKMAVSGGSASGEVVVWSGFGATNPEPVLPGRQRQRLDRWSR